MWLLLSNLLSVPTSAELFPGFLFSAQIRQPWDGESRYCRWRQLETDSQTETQRESKERLPVGKSLGLSVDSTTKAASHFVLICWPIMIKKKKKWRGQPQRGSSDEQGTLNICFQEFWFWVELGWTQAPLLSNRNSSCFTDGIGYLGPIWCIMCGRKGVPSSLIPLSRSNEGFLHPPFIFMCFYMENCHLLIYSC